LQLEYEQKLSENYLAREQLECIVGTFVNMALILLPLYASDFPYEDKRNYFRLLVEWHKRTPRVTERIVSEFIGLNPA